MHNILGIRREDLDKRGEQRVALAPEMVHWLTNQGGKVVIQPAVHPETGECKRGFSDAEYLEVGGEVNEDLSAARVIFGLKEIGREHLQEGKTYVFFSHTHKGQLKNRPLLQALVEKKATLIDYELMVNEKKQRVLTAFTYFAGYAGIIESLWGLSRRWLAKGIASPFLKLSRPTQLPDMGAIRELMRQIGEEIAEKGTPAEAPPLVVVFMGNGKTSTGGQEMLDLLPVETISATDLPRIFAEGNRRKVYKIVLSIPGMYRPVAGPEAVAGKSEAEIIAWYMREPWQFESDIDKVGPYATVLMNCVYWAPEFPRLLTRDMAAHWFREGYPLEVIGDISCDPDGAIQFSKETWPDEPGFIYHPLEQTRTPGYQGEGFAVMAVTNLPCEFPADASRQFSQEMHPLIGPLASADYDAPGVTESGLPPSLQQATILWKGEFTAPFAYMAAYLQKDLA